MNWGGLPVLTYHAIDTSGSVISTDPAWFAETMATLHDSGFRAIDLHDWIARGRPEVDRAFAITFDDGIRSIRRIADVLSRYRSPAAAFLVAGRMGRDNGWPGQPASIPRSPLLDWSDLPALARSGFRFGAHTRTHPRLDRVDDARLEDELRSSRDTIEQRLGAPCRLLAYPYGFAPERVRRAAARHFDAAFGTRLDYASGTEDPFALSRIDSYDLRSRVDLRRLIDGRWRPQLRLRRAVVGVRRARTALTGG